jgi:hypothetical protein
MSSEQVSLGLETGDLHVTTPSHFWPGAGWPTRYQAGGQPVRSYFPRLRARRSRSGKVFGQRRCLLHLR